jgi:hypothetical protein
VVRFSRRELCLVLVHIEFIDTPWLLQRSLAIELFCPFIDPVDHSIAVKQPAWKTSQLEGLPTPTFPLRKLALGIASRSLIERCLQGPEDKQLPFDLCHCVCCNVGRQSDNSSPIVSSSFLLLSLSLFVVRVCRFPTTSLHTYSV